MWEENWKLINVYWNNHIGIIDREGIEDRRLVWENSRGVVRSRSGHANTQSNDRGAEREGVSRVGREKLRRALLCIWQDGSGEG